MIDREKIACAMWKHSLGLNYMTPVYSEARTLEAFACAGPEIRGKWLLMAEAVMCVIPQAAPTPVEKFKIGPLTMEHVFEACGMTNVSDLQAVFDQTEKALEKPEPAEFWDASTTYDKAGYTVKWGDKTYRFTNSEKPEPDEQWDVPSADREDGVECLAFHRGKWCHVKWSQAHNGWSLGYGKAFLGPYGVDRPFAPLPSHVASASPNFYAWE